MDQQSYSTKPDLTILHFNDAYHISEEKKEPLGGAARFRTAIQSFAAQNPLVLFGGDIFNPSLLSTITQGKHMCHVINSFGVHTAVIGNHDFDFGLDTLSKLLSKTNTNWLLSNVHGFDTHKNKIPVCDMKEYDVFEWNGIQIGIIGLVEEDWLVTLTIDSSLFQYESFVDKGRRLAKFLKEEKKVQLVIALTHMRLPNDKILASEVPQIDLVLGGHDHEFSAEVINGTLVAKNASDFLTLVHVDIFLSKDGKKPKTEVKLVEINSKFAPDPELADHVKKYDEVMKNKMGKVIATTEVPLDAKSTTCRLKESNLGNYVTDVIRQELDVDVVLLNGGTIRSDRVYGPGNITLGDLIEVFPLEDIIVVLELTGSQVVAALENGVSQYPKLEGRFQLIFDEISGRFLQVSGIKFTWNSSRDPGKRIGKVFVHNKDWIPLELEKKYKVATKSYLCAGKDGFGMFLGARFLVDEENGLLLSTMIRRHWLKYRVVAAMRSPGTAVLHAVDRFKHRTSPKHTFIPKINVQVDGRIVEEKF